MTNRSLLQLALRAFGIVFCLVYPLFQIWPSGWQWTPSQGEYELMIVGVYAVLGVMLLLSASNPLKHSSLMMTTNWHSRSLRLAQDTQRPPHWTTAYRRG